MARQPREYTDDELLNLPPLTLSDEQKKRRSDIKKRRAAEARKAAKPKPPKPRARRVRKVSIHLPGQDATYTDAELLDLPNAVLNPDQVKRKNYLKRRIDQRKRNAANRRTRPPGIDMKDVGPGRNPQAGRAHCTEVKANGDPCGGWQSYGTEHCRWHMTKEELQSAGLEPVAGSSGAYTPLIGIKTTLTPPQIYRRVLEKSIAHMMNKKLNLFGLRLVGFDPHGDPVIEELPGGGVKLHGESKDGDIIMTGFEDIRTMAKEMETMLDRTFGKARQSLQLEGGSKPIEVKPVRSGERAREVANLLDGYGILPRHEGAQRSRRAPSKPAAKPAESEKE